MKRLLTLFCFLMLATVAWGINVTNYPQRVAAHDDDWF